MHLAPLFSQTCELSFRTSRSGRLETRMPNVSGRQVLMAVLERVLSDQWTEAMATAWSQLWQVEENQKDLFRVIAFFRLIADRCASQSTCEMMKKAIDDGEQVRSPCSFRFRLALPFSRSIGLETNTLVQLGKRRRARRQSRPGMLLKP